VNDEITASPLRLVSESGEALGTVSLVEALAAAAAAHLDLVEVAPTADPPVCKIMSWGDFVGGDGAAGDREPRAPRPTRFPPAMERATDDE
jgi:Translation initiation factor IF-3, N-terminal domain